MAMVRDELKELIEEYGRGYELLTAALAEVPRQAWEFKPAPQEWSVHELIVHMRDSEYMGVIRLHKLVAEPGSSIMTYQEDIWSQALHYTTQDEEDSLQIFKLMRRTTYRLLKSLPDQVFSNYVIFQEVVHPEYGDSYNIEKWLKIYTDHIPEHAGQLKQIYHAWKEQNP